MREPAKTIACAQTTTPSSSTSGSRSPRAAVERRDRLGGLPSTAPSWIVQPSPMTTPSWTTTCAPKTTSRPTDAVGLRTSPGAIGLGTLIGASRRA